MRPLRLLLPLLLALALLLPAAMPVQAQYPMPQLPERGKVGKPRKDMINLMEPIQDVMSGPGWLMAAGLDTRPWMDRPGWNAMNRQSLDKVDTPLRGADTPALQSVGPGVLVPFRDPSPAFSRDLLVTRDFSNRTLQTEPDLAVNPNDPDHLVLGVIDYNFPNNTAYVSIDGGQSWEGPQQIKYLRQDRVSGGDPVLTFGSEGQVFFASLSLGFEEYAIGNAVGFGMVSSIAMNVSDDGGFTWKETVSTARSTIETDVETDLSGRPRGTVQLGFLDKPWITTGIHPTMEDTEVIYISYINFETLFEILYIGEIPTLGLPEAHSTPMLVSSTDNGQTWSDPVKVGPTVRRTYGEVGDDTGAGQAVGTKRVVQGPAPVVDSEGNLYVIWLDTTDDKSMEGTAEFYLAKSDDGGETFTEPKRIASFLEPGFRPRNAYFRYWASAFPKVAIGPEDEMYVVFTALPPDNPQDEGDVYFIRSTDGGNRWSRPKRINTDETDAPQFFPAVDVGPDGKLHVMWGDMRDDPVAIRYHIYYTSSEDQGDTWGFKMEEIDLDVGDARVTDFPSNPNKGFPSGLFLGDYFAIQAVENDAYMVWADTRLGEYGGVNQKIGFSRTRPLANPEIFLNPDTGPGGETVTVQGHGFQPDMNIFLQMGGRTVTSGRTNGEGRFTASVFVPISGEGAHPVTLVDDSGNFASGTFYMEFGFDNIQQQLDALDAELDGILNDGASAPAGVAPLQQVSNPQNVEHMQAELTEIKAMLATLNAEEAVVPAQLVATSSTIAGIAAMPWGMAALGGLLVGAALMFVRMSVRRGKDK